MKKIKIFVTILYVSFAVEMVGAWRMEPDTKEAAAYVENMNMRHVLEENQEAVREWNARVEYSRIKAEETEKSNVYYCEINEGEERKLQQQLEEERRRKERIREKRREERKILERIVEAEAGDQDLKGRILVANVIQNRVKSSHFPDTVKEVVFAHRQFSPVQNGRYYQVEISEKTKIAVKKALEGKDYSEGALYFMCRSASSPSNVAWFDRSLTKVKTHGGHEFFR